MTDLALAATITAAGTLPPDNPTNMNDGDPSTFSRRDSLVVGVGTHTTYWDADLGSAQTVESMAISEGGVYPWIPGASIFRSSDGIAWTSVSYTETIGPSGGYNIYNYAFTTPQTYRYFRIGWTVTVDAWFLYVDYLQAGLWSINDAPAPEPAEPVPGFWIDFSGDGFDETEYDNVSADLKAANVRRGANGDLTGSSGVGSGSFVLIDTNGLYNPQNASSPLYGMLKDGLRVWAGLTEDGYLSGAGDVYGILAGYVTDITPIPSGGTDDPATVEFTFEDPLAWFGRAKVQLADNRLRSQKELREEVLDALHVIERDLCEEPTTMPLSSADGYAINILDELNRANGTRHYARPHDVRDTWWTYVSIRRTDHLDGVADATLDGNDDIVNTDGWRTSADTVVNQQKATITPIIFPTGREVCWEAESTPFTFTGTTVVWAEFPDYVDLPVPNIVSSGDAVTTSIEPFGRSAKLILISAGTSVIEKLTIDGYLLERGQAVSLQVDDTDSQVAPRGVRAGPDISSDYLGIGVSAYGICEHIVWRYADPKVRPSVEVKNWFTEMLSLDLLDVISFSSSHLSVTDRLFDIVGMEFLMQIAAPDGPVVLHTVTYQLQENRVQEAFGWFTLDVSETDEDDVLAY